MKVITCITLIVGVALDINQIHNYGKDGGMSTIKTEDLNVHCIFI